MKFQRSRALSCNKISTGVGENSFTGKGDLSSKATEDIKKSLSSGFSMTCKATSSERVSLAKDKAYLNALADSSEKSMGTNILFSLRMISSCYAVPIVSIQRRLRSENAVATVFSLSEFQGCFV
jgi:hypothetical protein